MLPYNIDNLTGKTSAKEKILLYSLMSAPPAGLLAALSGLKMSVQPALFIEHLIQQ